MRHVPSGAFQVTPDWAAPARRASPPPTSAAITSGFSSSRTNLALSARLPPPRKGPRGAGARAPLPPMCLGARAQSHGPASRLASGRRARLPLAHALSPPGRGKRAAEVGPTVRGQRSVPTKHGLGAATASGVVCSACSWVQASASAASC